jgi:hypothetical protein
MWSLMFLGFGVKFELENKHCQRPKHEHIG